MLVGAAVATVLAVATGLTLGRVPLNVYDVSFSLDWGRELLHGDVPDVHVIGASTPHPLAIMSGGIATLFGDHALAAVQAFLLLAAGVVVVALIAVGRACRMVGLGFVAVGALVLSEPFVFNTLGEATASDLPSAAAVISALAFEAARPRRGVLPLALLAAAGLWRPEVWLLSLAYLLYAGRGRPWRSTVGLAGLALLAPLLWAGTDLLLTGNPLYSLTYTKTSAAVAQRPTGLANVPATLWDTLSSYLSTPVLVGAALGLALDLRSGRLPRVLPVALVLSLVSFLILGASGLPLNDRYALPTVLLIALYFGFFVVGWGPRAAGWLRRGWSLAAAVLVAAALLLAPANLRALRVDRQALTQQAAAARHLQSLVASPRMRQLILGCSPVQAGYRVVPLLAYDLRINPRRLVSVDSGVPLSGVVIEPRRGVAAQLFEAHSHPRRSLLRRNFTVLAANDSWRVYTSCR